MCFGGEIHEALRVNVAQFTAMKTTERISFQEWNGDYIAGLLMEGILGQQLVSKELRGSFQKSIAMLHGWEAKDRFYNGNHPFLCDCGARYLIAETSVSQAFDLAETVDGDAGLDRQAKANLMCELYVILGALDAPAAVLDQVLAAVEGEQLPYSTLIPFENDKRRQAQGRLQLRRVGPAPAQAFGGALLGQARSGHWLEPDAARQTAA